MLYASPSAAWETRTRPLLGIEQPEVRFAARRRAEREADAPGVPVGMER